jgi:hypothetical protein
VEIKSDEVGINERAIKAQFIQEYLEAEEMKIFCVTVTGPEAIIRCESVLPWKKQSRKLPPVQSTRLNKMEEIDGKKRSTEETRTKERKIKKRMKVSKQEIKSLLHSSHTDTTDAMRPKILGVVTIVHEK